MRKWLRGWLGIEKLENYSIDRARELQIEIESLKRGVDRQATVINELPSAKQVKSLMDSVIKQGIEIGDLSSNITKLVVIINSRDMQIDELDARINQAAQDCKSFNILLKPKTSDHIQVKKTIADTAAKAKTPRRSSGR